MYKFTSSLAAAIIAASVSTTAHGATMLTGAMTADNGFFAWVGTAANPTQTLVASGNNWYGSVLLTPTALAPGNYSLNIEVVNYGGPGALLGSFNIGGQTLVTDATDWTASYASAYAGDNNSSIPPLTAQPWVAATGGVINYQNATNGSGGPWGFNGAYADIASNAQWIDAATNGLSVCNYCTVDFSAQFTVTGAPSPAPGEGWGTFAAIGALVAFLARYRGVIV